MSGDDAKRQAESRRILERVAREAEPDRAAAREAKRGRDHASAGDTDDEDWVEYWGTRIGRGLGVVLLIGLIAWLILFLMRG
jgi:hypothetical protein